MKTAKALKLKNRLAGEVSRLKQIVQTYNSREETREEVYNVKTIVEKTLPQRVKELVLVKTSIACANAGEAFDLPGMYEKTAYWRIFMMAELKGLIETYRAMETKCGSFFERYAALQGNAEPKPTVYVAAFHQTDIDALVGKAEHDIDNLQDELDAHNATVNIPLLDVIKL